MNNLLTKVIFLVLVINFIIPTYGNCNMLRVTYLDVGQGDSELIRLPNGKNILIDAGDDRLKSAERVIIPYLKKNGINSLDCVIISHAHRDHLGGLLVLLNKIPVKKVIETHPSTTQMYKEILNIIKRKKIPHAKGFKGDILHWDSSCKTEILHPPRTWTTKDYSEIFKGDTNRDNVQLGSNLNNFSIVLRLQYKKMVYLFGGDAEIDAENEMIADNSPSKFKTTVYKASHHGSKTSSSPHFLQYIKPKYVVISVGKHNQFHHPSPQTIKNLSYYTPNVYRTDEDGTIESWTDGKTIHFSYSGTPNSIVETPIPVHISPNSATIHWTTSRPSSTSATVNGKTYFISENVSDHYITIDNLKPSSVYQYKVTSVDTKNVSLTSSGEFTTLPSTGISASITNFKVTPKIPVIGEKAIIKANVKGASKVIFYRKCVADNFRIGVSNVSGNSVRKSWTPENDSISSIFAEVIEKGRTVLVKKLKLKIKKKIVLIDVSHNNYGSSMMESMRLNLCFHGFDARMNRSKLSATLLKNVSVLIITEPDVKNQYKAAEISILDKYVKKGGSILFVSRADYKDSSKPASLNKILKKIGSNMRFNDDQVMDPKDCSGSSQWVLRPKTFSRKIISKSIKQIIASSSCSILNGEMKPVKSTDDIISIAKTSTSAKNIDSDGNGDAVIYPSGAITIDSAEILPSGGKIALFGSSHIFSTVYNYASTNNTPDYNNEVIKWLSTAKSLKIDELARRLTINSLNNDLTNDVYEGISNRNENIKDKLMEEFNSMELTESLPQIVKMLKSFPQSEREKLSDVIKDIINRSKAKCFRNMDIYEKVRKNLEELENIYNNM